MSRISKGKKQRLLLDQQRITKELKRARNRWANPAPETLEKNAFAVTPKRFCLQFEGIFRRAA